MLSTDFLTPNILVELHGFEYERAYSENSAKVKQLQATQKNENIFTYLCEQKILVPYGAEFLLNKEFGTKQNLDVSFYKSCNLPSKLQIPTNTSILSIFNDVKNGKYAEICTNLRDLAQKERAEDTTPEQAKKHKETRTKLKLKLPCFATSGIFPNSQRNSQSLVKGTYTGLMQVDIDYKGNGNIGITFNDLKQELQKLPYVFAVFTSPSGDLKCFVRHNAPAEHHQKAFFYIENMFNSTFDVKIDEQCKDISRVCFVSYDENIYVNENCTSLKIDYDLAQKIAETPNYEKRFSGVPKKEGTNKFTNIVDFCVFCVEKTHAFVPGNKSDYRYNLACLMNDYGVPFQDAQDFINTNYPREGGKAIFDVKSAYKKTERHGKKTFTVYDNKNYSKPKPNVITQIGIAKTFEQHSKQGIKFENTVKNISEIQNIDAEIVKEIGNKFIQGEFAEDLAIENKDIPQYTRIKAFLSKNYDFKINEVSNTLFYRNKGKKDFIVCNEANLEDHLFEIGFKDFKDKLSTLLACDFVPKFNPFLDYFENLPAWDGKTDYIDLLANTVDATNQVWFNSQFKKMIVRMVAQSLHKIDFNKHCFVIASPKQNIGKSSFMKYLCPKKLKDYSTETINFLDKDGTIALCENFIVNLDELSHMPKNELEKVKSLFSQTTTKVRRPFAKKAEPVHRVANFVGSTNKTEILTDTTGNVRFLIFEINEVKIDPKTQKNLFESIDMDLVYSQAYTMLKNGFYCKLTTEEIKFSEGNNKNFAVYSFEKELLEKHFTPARKTDKDAEFYTTTDFLKFLCEKYPNLINKININKVGSALQSLGFLVEYKFFKEINNNKKGYYFNLI